MKSSAAADRALAGMMKNAFIPCTSRRSWLGIRVICDEIFCSALIRYSGAPVSSAEPRSAAYSRERANEHVADRVDQDGDGEHDQPDGRAVVVVAVVAAAAESPEHACIEPEA